MAQVFISYSRKDLTFVEQLVSDLKKTGIDVWYDLSGLEGGSRWGMEIRKAIQNSEYVIVVLSPDSVESEWVEREYLFSNNQKKKTLPIMYRECELPLGFMNVNYVDVQGENYSRNFDKIARFLNTKPLDSVSASTPTKTGRTIPEKNSRRLVLLGAVAALAVAVMFVLLNGRGTNTGLNSNGVITPVQTVIPSTLTSERGITPVTETSTSVQQTATATEQAVPTSGVMSTSASIQVDADSQAIFIQSAAGRNMTAHWTVIEDTLASNQDALVFAMPNWTAEVYNNHLVAVWYHEAQWTILNQDMRSMPHEAAFNVRIVSEGDNAFVHTATASNIKESWTVINHPLATEDALVFAMPTWSLGGVPTKDNNHPIGVWHTGKEWAIINLDHAPMREGAAFNIQILSPGMNVFVHRATSLNTSENWTALDDTRFAKDETKLVFVMPRGSPDASGVNNSHPIGVWYNGTQWTIFNQDTADMLEGAAFNILILDAN